MWSILFRVLLYREVLKFISCQTFGWECIRKASLRVHTLLNIDFFYNKGIPKID